MDKYQETFKTWNKVAEDYEIIFMDFNLYNDSYDDLISLFPKNNAEILDIGCGPGNISKYLVSRRPDIKVTGIDTSENMIALAKKNIPSGDFKVMDARNIGSIKKSFDAIICGFCMPYLSISDTLKLMDDCKNALNPNGILYMSFVEGYTEESGYVTSENNNRVYFYYHNKDHIQKQLSSKGFRTVKIFNKPYEKKDATLETHTIIIAQKV